MFFFLYRPLLQFLLLDHQVTAKIGRSVFRLEDLGRSEEVEDGRKTYVMVV